MTSDNLTALGVLLNRVRDDHNLLQRELAEELGCSRQFLIQMSAGEKALPQAMEDALVLKFNVDQQEVQEAAVLQRTMLPAEWFKPTEILMAHRRFHGREG